MLPYFAGMSPDLIEVSDFSFPESKTISQGKLSLLDFSGEAFVDDFIAAVDYFGLD